MPPVEAQPVASASQKSSDLSFFQLIKGLVKINQPVPSDSAALALDPNSDSIGHGPLAVRDKAQRLGLTVRQENNGSLEDLAALIDKGIPPLVLGIYGGGANSSLNDYIANAGQNHWMVVTGYQRDDLGAVSQVSFNNPGKNEPQSWSAWNFTNKFWDNNVIPGGHRYYMAMARKESYQAGLLDQALPEDKISISFDSFLHATDQLENDFYAAEAKKGRFA